MTINYPTNFLRTENSIRRNGMSKNLLAISTVVVTFGSSAFAQSDAVLAPQASLPSPSTQLAFPTVAGAPSAVAPRSGSGFVGLTYATPRGGVSGAGGDGDLVAGYSVGSPLENLSLTFGLALTGLEPLGDAGSLSLSASRLARVSGNSATFVGATVSNLAAWGVNSNRSEQYTVYASHIVAIEKGNVEVPLQFVVGYGTENTRQSDGIEIEDGAFAGVGVGITPNMSASMSFTETQLNLGASFNIPNSTISTSLNLLDVTDNTNRQQMTLSVAYGF
ncbi:hypothetical protein [Sulfitobacter sp. W074]|uniref:hypothetical protein n=1 Tax=Sulfitobacter sp. W074 TaxID=2867026 RepID=UPI0021A8F09A|nr:hypothetical protein [Sulfitobacter sp. W074]UWR39603.1 hypothetical protein K3762_19410 [Sulfitobacter sp. W074]